MNNCKTVVVKLPSMKIICPSCYSEIDLEDDELDINVKCECGQHIWTETEE